MLATAFCLLNAGMSCHMCPVPFHSVRPIVSIELVSCRVSLEILFLSVGPGSMSRAEYSRKVFVASKTGYLSKKSSTSQQAAAKGAGIGKIKFLNYVSKKRYFVLTGESLMYHHDHAKLDDPLHSKVFYGVCGCIC